MKLASLLNPALIRCGASPSGRDAAFADVASLVEARVAGLTAQEVLTALAERERLGPFSMSKGVVFLHARTEKVPELTVALSTCASAVDLGAPDGLPARLFILMLIPKKHSNLYLQTMALFLNHFSREENLRRALAASTPESVIEAFEAPKECGRRTARELADASVPRGTLRTPLAEIVTMLNGRPAVPIVDDQGQLIGEVRSTTLLKAAVGEILASLSNTASLRRERTVGDFVADHGSAPLGDARELVSNGTLPTIADDEPVASAALRLARSGRDYAYVVSGNRLVGLVRSSQFLVKHGS